MRRGELCNEKIDDYKVPVPLLLGKREAEERRVSVRRFGGQAQIGLD